MAPIELVQDTMASISPLIKAAEGAEAMLLLPMPRNIEGACCTSPEHMPGYRPQEFRDRLTQQMNRFRKTVKQAARRLKLQVVVANMAKTVLEAPGGWLNPTMANIPVYQAMIDKIALEVIDRHEGKAVGAWGKRKAPATWSTGTEKRAAPSPGQQRHQQHPQQPHQQPHQVQTWHQTTRGGKQRPRGGNRGWTRPYRRGSQW